MLRKELEEHPDDIRCYLQLVQEYTSINSWDKAEEYCRQGRAVCCGNPVYQGWLQANLGTILYEKGDGKFAIQEISSMLENEHPCELVRLILYNLLIHCMPDRIILQMLSDTACNLKSFCSIWKKDRNYGHSSNMER